MIRALLVVVCLAAVVMITARLIHYDRTERIAEQRRNERLRELRNRRAADELTALWDGPDYFGRGQR